MARGRSEAPGGIRNMGDAHVALERIEEIKSLVEPLEQEAVRLKKAVTEYAVKRKIDVIQIDGVYYRQIVRHSRGWDSKKLRAIASKISVKVDGRSKSLWLLITRRVPD